MPWRRYFQAKMNEPCVCSSQTKTNVTPFDDRARKKYLPRKSNLSFSCSLARLVQSVSYVFHPRNLHRHVTVPSPASKISVRVVLSKGNLEFLFSLKTPVLTYAFVMTTETFQDSHTQQRRWLVERRMWWPGRLCIVIFLILFDCGVNYY